MRQVFPSTNTYLLIDTREKSPSLLQAVKSWKYRYEFQTLPIADYACSDLCCFFERKENDFTVSQSTSINRQLANMQSQGQNCYLVVNTTMTKWMAPEKSWQCYKCKWMCGKATHCARCGASHKSYHRKMGFLHSLSARGLTPHWIDSHSMMLDWILGTVFKNHDTKFRGPGAYSPLRQVTHKDLAMNMLITLPGVGSGMATEILANYDSPGEFLMANPKDWLKLKGMGKKKVDQILTAFWKGVDQHE